MSVAVGGGDVVLLSCAIINLHAAEVGEEEHVVTGGDEIEREGSRVTLVLWAHFQCLPGNSETLR